MDAILIVDAINTILGFNKIVIMSIFTKQHCSDEKIIEIRNACRVISEAGLYPFDLDCNNTELMMQIEVFIEEGMKD